MIILDNKKARLFGDTGFDEVNNSENYQL